MTSYLVIIFPPKVYTSEPRCALVLPDKAWRSRRAVVGSGFPPRPRSKKHGGCRAHASRKRAAATTSTGRRTECLHQQRRREFSPAVWRVCSFCLAPGTLAQIGRASCRGRG